MNIRSYIDAQKKQMIGTLESLVRRESPTNDKKAVDECSRSLLRSMSGLGKDILRIPQDEIGDLYAVGFPGFGDRASRPILILTHVDTVWPVGQLRDMPWRRAGPRVFGPGVLDMKAGLVIVLFALRAVEALKLNPRRPVILFINSAEETGHPAPNKWIEQLARRSACVLCLEPALPGGALKTRRKGRLVIDLRTQGRAAHAATPQNGVNAIEELMAQVARLRSLARGATSLNIGLIRGGTKANVVPDGARAVLDFRFWTQRDEARIRERLKALAPVRPGAKVSYSVESTVPPMERSGASRDLFAKASLIASRCGFRLKGGETGGGSDASFAASLGLPTLDGLGPDGDGIHAANEHILIPSFLDRAVLLAALLVEL